MKYKIAICKIYMIGEPALILGFCRYDDDDAFWQKFQYFTMENYLHCKYTYKAPDPNDPFSGSMYKSQEDCDKASEYMRKCAEKRSKYHQMVVHFDSINKDIEVKQYGHDFDLSKAESVEITKQEWQLLSKELNQDQWMKFDEETWGK